MKYRFTIIFFFSINNFKWMILDNSCLYQNWVEMVLLKHFVEENCFRNCLKLSDMCQKVSCQFYEIGQICWPVYGCWYISLIWHFIEITFHRHQKHGQRFICDRAERLDFWSRLWLFFSPFIFPPKKRGKKKMIMNL